MGASDGARDIPGRKEDVLVESEIQVCVDEPQVHAKGRILKLAGGPDSLAQHAGVIRFGAHGRVEGGDLRGPVDMGDGPGQDLDPDARGGGKTCGKTRGDAAFTAQGAVGQVDGGRVASADGAVVLRLTSPSTLPETTPPPRPAPPTRNRFPFSGQVVTRYWSEKL